MEDAARIMEEKGVSEDSEGAVIVDLTKYSKKLGKAVVKKKDGMLSPIANSMFYCKVMARFHPSGISKAGTIREEIRKPPL